MGILATIGLIGMTAMLGADHPAGPVHNSAWPAGIEALANVPERVHGYFVNFEDVFFYQGGTDRFNRFLAEYAKVPNARRQLVVHRGKLAVRSPWDRVPRKLKAEWTLYATAYGKPELRPHGVENSRVDLWLDGTIDESKLAFPKGLDVEYADPVSMLLSVEGGRISLTLAAKSDAIVNLGRALANGEILQPSNVELIATDAVGTTTHLLYQGRVAGVGGRIDDLIVPLMAGSSYGLRFDLSEFVAAPGVEAKLKPGTYRLAAKLNSRAPQFENGDMAGVKLLKLWTGTIEAPPVTIELPLK